MAKDPDVVYITRLEFCPEFFARGLSQIRPGERLFTSMAAAKSFHAQILIRATPEAIWTVLTDAASYPRWNNTVNKVEGRIAQGQTVTVHPKVSQGRTFPVKVVKFEAPRTMVWSSGMPLGLFKGERTFTLTPKSQGVEFDMREEFTGLLAPLIGRSIPDLQPAFNEFAADLKRKMEA